jgi:hypothetical protein
MPVQLFRVVHDVFAHNADCPQVLLHEIFVVRRMPFGGTMWALCVVRVAMAARMS